jgi:hypothetical protein
MNYGRGVLVIQSGATLLIRCGWDDGNDPPAPQGEGTATVAMTALSVDGSGVVSMLTYDWISHTFKASGMTAGGSVAALTHLNRLGDADASVATGIWATAETVLDGLTPAMEWTIICICTHSTQGWQAHQFQYGGTGGDAVEADVRKWLNRTAPEFASDVLGTATVTANNTDGITVQTDSTPSSTNIGQSLTIDGQTRLIASVTSDSFILAQALPSSVIRAGKIAYLRYGVPAVTTGGEAIPASGITGDGDTEVDHDTGGTDNLRYTTSGNTGIGNATVRAHLKAEYDAGTYTLRGNTTTKDDGRWVAPLRLDSGLTYTIVLEKTGVYGPNAIEVTIP